MDAAIINLQDREDREGGLPNEDLVDLQGLLALHHSLLWQQETFWR